LEEVKIYLGEDRIYTDATGIKQILKFFKECKEFKNCLVNINLDNVEWFDGNLCAFLGAMLYRLTIENNLTFTMDASQVSAKFGVLFANNFLPIDQNLQQYKIDSCLPFKGFYPKEKDEFYDYLDKDLFNHPAMPKLEHDVKEKLIDDLSEVYGNIDKHAETEYPFFVCGQYYPFKNTLNFTISDLGVGFFKKISLIKPKEIQNCGDAILWALAGNSTKEDAPGGSGLKNLCKYFKDNKGSMQIYTGDYGWSSETENSILYPKGVKELNHYYMGATINLQFNTKSLTLKKV
jgi:hypothetical protein